MRNITRWSLSLLHGCLLFAFTIYWLNSNLTYGDERFLVKWTSVFKRVALRIDHPPPAKQYLFINLAYDKALIPREDGTGKDIITDRKLLADYFSVLRRNPGAVRYTVCDVLLKGSSPDDSALQASVRGINNVIFPADETDSSKLSVDVPAANADYEIAKEGFLKFKIIQPGGGKSLPLTMYEQLQHKKIRHRFGLYWDDGRPVLQSIIVDYQLRPHQLFTQGAFPVISLSELLLLPEEVVVNEFLKDRIVLMGDFEHDMHETVYGPMPGTLVLMNVYLNLVAGRQLINTWWLLFIIAAFTFLSKVMIFTKQQDNRPAASGWKTWLLRSAGFLTVLSILSYLLFNVHIQVLVLTIYLNALRFLLQAKRSDFHWKKIQEWLLGLRDIFFNFK